MAVDNVVILRHLTSDVQSHISATWLEVSGWRDLQGGNTLGDRIIGFKPNMG
jgi:hypothetical protein